MRLVIVVPFLNEEAYLGTLLDSISRQSRPPHRLLLVDDGSSDGSLRLARQFADHHEYATVLARPPRQTSRDRLAQAAELVAFCWAVDQLDNSWDVVAKVDADLRLTPLCFENLEARLEEDHRLGIAGAYLSVVGPDGRAIRERCPPHHVRGATKFYRRECFEQISPLPPILGWDTIDEVAARRRGWHTATFAVSSGDPIHMRPTATYDGALQGFRRGGAAAYAYGAHPVWVLLGTARRLREPPWVVGGLSFMMGWLLAALRRQPRAQLAERAFLWAEQKQRIRRAIGRTSNA